MKLKLYSCHHTFPESIVATDLFQTFVSGIATAGHPTLLSDVKGEGIPYDNRYSEMRHQYFAWKNLLAEVDYIGFEALQESVFSRARFG
jgi:hypothetical protein